MLLTVETLAPVTHRRADIKNVHSVVIAINRYGEVVGLDQPHRLTQYLAQLTHENNMFVHDVEVWGKDGGTKAQKRYDTRTDLGNTPEVDGDGYKYRGRTGIQVTGKSNYQQFYNWCVSKGLNPPDFVENPDLINLDPWEGLAPIWYWDTRNLNAYADTGNNEMITRRVNGGLNGYSDRLKKYSIIGLSFLGFDYTADGLRAFQTVAKSKGFYDGDVDGEDGPKTRSAIHRSLIELGSIPVTQTKVAPVSDPVLVAPKGAEKVSLNRFSALVSAVATGLLGFVPADPYIRGGLVVIAMVGLVVVIWKAELIASRVKAAIKAFGLHDD